MQSSCPTVILPTAELPIKISNFIVLQFCVGLIQEFLNRNDDSLVGTLADFTRFVIGSDFEGDDFSLHGGDSCLGADLQTHGCGRNMLDIQLRTHGLTPHPIALDDYFVNREDTPLDENGDHLCIYYTATEVGDYIFRYSELQGLKVNVFDEKGTELFANEDISGGFNPPVA